MRMRIHLDTKCLIDVSEKSKPCHLDQLNEVLRTGGHTLALTVFNVLEISAPLIQRNAKTNVMTLLSQLDALPLEYISEPKVILLELQEALGAFRAEREYYPIQPHEKRFDAALSLREKPTTAMFINFSLAENVFTLWGDNPEIFSLAHSYQRRLELRFQKDRALPKPPSLANNFIQTLGRDLKEFEIPIDPDELDSFATWVYEDSRRCPAMRLSYEAYHQILRNTRDVPKRGDIGDFAHLKCTPYVDLLTLDSRMRTYAKQACDAANMPFAERLHLNLTEVLERLRVPAS